ncbi:MAG: hypothetical protein HQL22_04275 [Candidatus Omnitrophica bacterium]|nr:hypothetical protein [Candidatus Omnitrophota bacterium]
MEEEQEKSTPQESQSTHRMTSDEYTQEMRKKGIEYTESTMSEPEYKKHMEEDSKGIVIEVDDPSTAEAINRYQHRIQKINGTCFAKISTKSLIDRYNAAEECACAQPAENLKALNDKISAISNLIKRRPELLDQFIKVKGTPGTIYINSSALHQMTLSEFNESNKCR